MSRTLLLCLALAIGCNKESKELAAAKAAQAQAEKIASEAMKQATEAEERVERVERDSNDLASKVQSLADTLQAAQSDADRASATEKLNALLKEKAEMDARIKKAKEQANRAKRQPMRVSDECKENPLAKGCQ